MTLNSRPTWSWGSSIAACFIGEERPEKIAYLTKRLRTAYRGMDEENRRLFKENVLESPELTRCVGNSLWELVRQVDEA